MRVVIISSFAAIIDASRGNSIPDKTYSEADWNPITEKEAFEDPVNGYRGMYFDHLIKSSKLKGDSK
jgi:hypothetical protein